MGETTTIVETLKCTECGQAVFLASGGLVTCENGACAMAGVSLPLGQWARLRELLTPTPAGLPRPVFGGRPVPWTTLVVAGTVYWRHLDDARVMACQRDFLCQVCGLGVDTGDH